MSKRFSYTLSQFKLNATTFCNMKSNYFYYIIHNLYQKGLDEKLLNTVSLAKDVLNNIENTCSTFLVKDASLCVQRYSNYLKTDYECPKLHNCKSFV